MPIVSGHAQAPRPAGIPEARSRPSRFSAALIPVLIVIFLVIVGLARASSSSIR